MLTFLELQRVTPQARCGFKLKQFELTLLDSFCAFHIRESTVVDLKFH
jgi:hypothetical protein